MLDPQRRSGTYRLRRSASHLARQHATFAWLPCALDLAPGTSIMMAAMDLDHAESEPLSIGEFARRTGLTTKALRIYDDLGLLRPIDVNPSNGYRRYNTSQIATARLIGMLRGVDLTLAAIAQLLSDLDTDRDLAVRRLNDHLISLEKHHTGRRFLIRHINALLREEERPMFPVHTRHVSAQRVLSIQRRVRAHETDPFVAEAKALFAQHLNGAAPIGPFTVIFHGIVDHETDGPLEVTLGCPDHIQASDVIGIRTEPAHDEAYTTITKAQWEYPAILAAYDAVSCSPEAVARSGSRLSCREVYLAEPDAISDDDLICDVAFPLSEIAYLRP
jgi:DNA-binding transcriptional MerR regulator